MKNFEEIMSERKNRIEARKDELIRRSLLSEEFLEMIQKNKRPFDLLDVYKRQVQHPVSASEILL